MRGFNGVPERWTPQYILVRSEPHEVREVRTAGGELLDRDRGCGLGEFCLQESSQLLDVEFLAGSNGGRFGRHVVLICGGILWTSIIPRKPSNCKSGSQRSWTSTFTRMSSVTMTRSHLAIAGRRCS